MSTARSAPITRPRCSSGLMQLGEPAQARVGPGDGAPGARRRRRGRRPVDAGRARAVAGGARRRTRSSRRTRRPIPSPGSGPVWLAQDGRVGPQHLVQHLVERAARTDDAERVGERRGVDEDVAPRHRRAAAVGDGLESLERAAEVADALGQVVLVLATTARSACRLFSSELSAGESWLTRLLVWLAMASTLVIEVGQVLVVGRQAGRDGVEVVDDGEQLLVPAGQGRRQRVRRVDQLRDLAARAGRPSSSARRGPEMIWATCVCLSLVMAAEEVTRLLSALRVRLREQRVRGVLQLVELGGHRRVGDRARRA